MARTGRPKKDIDKKQFENLCGLQCTINEMCAFFDCDDKTLNKWCRDTYKMSFSEVFALKKGVGDISLRRSQFRLAETNPTMAIWLGKQRLKQTDSPQMLESRDDERPYELPGRVLGREWADINRDIDARKHYMYDFKGGRGSLKSSYCALKLIELVKANDAFCALAVRQVKDTLKDSVYAQITWAIDELGLSDEFHCTKSPLEIRRKATSQIIFFRGADDPMKIKSIKPPKGKHIGIVWIEEADQLHGPESLRNILQSAMRGGDDCLVFRSYNTPRSQQHYINKEERTPNDGRMVHHSHFLNAPPEWLGKKFYEMAEHLKETNPKAYAHEYDGEAVGTGANVFENVTLRAITDGEIDAFDRLYYGIDWGFCDPAHFCECYYNAAQRRLWIFGELRRYKLCNGALADLLEDWKGCRITADSAEPKSIADFRAYGFNVHGAIKGPGSVEYSMKWLAGLTEIIIDPARCPESAEEFATYEYEKNKDGEIISGYPDCNNHAIDSVRYAMEEVWRRRGQ